MASKVRKATKDEAELLLRLYTVRRTRAELDLEEKRLNGQVRRALEETEATGMQSKEHLAFLEHTRTQYRVKDLIAYFHIDEKEAEQFQGETTRLCLKELRS